MTLSDILTFSRTSAATYVDGNGYVATAAAHEPRIDHDPATLERIGYLVEGASQNDFEASQDFTDPSWVPVGSAVVPGAGIAPDGSASATLVREDSADALHHLASLVALTSGDDYSCAVWVKAAGRGFARIVATGNIGGAAQMIVVDLTTGGTAATGGVTARARPFRDGWWRISLSGAATATGSVWWRIGPSDSLSTAETGYQGDGTSGVLVWGAQFEAQAHPTSYIATSGTAANRSADRAEVPVGSWFRGDELSLYMEARPLWDRDDSWIAALHDGTIGNRISLHTTASKYTLTTYNDLVADVYMAVGDVVAGSTEKIAFASAANDWRACINGGAVSVDVTGAMPGGLTTLEVGRLVGDYRCWHGHIRDLRFYPRRLTDAELQAITA